jgi:hypothetical protein
MGTAGTTNSIDFTADDGVQVVTNTATIVVPWDANANSMPGNGLPGHCQALAARVIFGEESIGFGGRLCVQF